MDWRTASSNSIGPGMRRVGFGVDIFAGGSGVLIVVVLDLPNC